MRTLSATRFLRSIRLALVVIGLGAPAAAQGVMPMDEDDYHRIPVAPVPAGTVGRQAPHLDESLLPRVGDQGRQSSCAAWAVALAWSYQLRQGGHPSNLLVSPRYLYARTRSIGDNTCGRGTFIPAALEVLRDEGAPPVTRWPSPECNLGVTDDERIAANALRARGFARVELSDTAALRAHLADGHPVVLSLRVTEHFEAFRASYYTRLEGNDTGFHAAVLIGHDPESGAWRIQNSWGDDWGDHGRVWLSNDAFRAMLREAYVIQAHAGGRCRNGRVWDGSECVCPTPFPDWSDAHGRCVRRCPGGSRLSSNGDACVTTVAATPLDTTGAQSNYGAHALPVGYTRRIAVNAGGNLDARSMVLGGVNGVGWITARPDAFVDVTGPAAQLSLQTVAVGSADVTLLVLTPDGRWFVDDDGAGALQARVVIPQAPAGRYRVWVGTYNPGSASGFPETAVVATAQ